MKLASYLFWAFAIFLPSLTAAEELGLEPSLEPTTFKFPAKINRVHVGGGGRYLILRMDSRGEASVFDLLSLKTVLSFPVDPNWLITAGLDKILVVSPFDAGCQKWSLKTMKQAGAGRVQIQGVIKNVSMGYAAKTPALVTWAADTNALSRINYGVMDTNSLRVNQIRTGATQNVRGMPFFHYLSFRDNIHIRVSANGQLFGMWNPSARPSGMQVLYLGRSPVTVYAHESVGHVIPTADGSKLCTEKGLYLSSSAAGRRGRHCFPTCHPKFCIAYRGNAGFEVFDTATLITHPTLTNPIDLAGTDTVQDFDWSKRKPEDIPIDSRFHCVPQLDLVASIPSTDDRIIVRKIAFGLTEQEKLSQPFAFDTKRKTKRLAVPTYRTWTDTTGGFKVVAKIIDATQDTVVLQKKSGEEITVPRTRLSARDEKLADEFFKAK